MLITFTEFIIIYLKQITRIKKITRMNRNIGGSRCVQVVSSNQSERRFQGGFGTSLRNLGQQLEFQKKSSISFFHIFTQKIFKAAKKKPRDGTSQRFNICLSSNFHIKIILL